MIVIALNFVPNIVGSDFGSCRDGCGIRLCSSICIAEGVPQLAACCYTSGHKLLCGTGVGQSLRLRCFGYNGCFLCRIGISIGGRRRDCRVRARRRIPASGLVGVVRLAANCRNLVCRQFEGVALITRQGHGLICRGFIVPGTIHYLEGHGLADAVLLRVGIGVGRIRRYLRVRARRRIPASGLVSVVRLAANCRNLVCGQFQGIAIMSGKGHSLVCCCSIAFALIPFSVHYLKGHRVRNKSLDCQFLICGRIGCIGCLKADIVCSGNKTCDVAACSNSPTLGIRLLILHSGRNAGELSVVVV